MLSSLRAADQACAFLILRSFAESSNQEPRYLKSLIRLMVFSFAVSWLSSSGML